MLQFNGRCVRIFFLLFDFIFMSVCYDISIIRNVWFCCEIFSFEKWKWNFNCLLVLLLSVCIFVCKKSLTEFLCYYFTASVCILICKEDSLTIWASCWRSCERMKECKPSSYHLNWIIKNGNFHSHCFTVEKYYLQHCICGSNRKTDATLVTTFCI